MFLQVFHLSVILLNSFTLWYDQNYVDVPIPEEFQRHTDSLPFKSRFLFLTIWVLVLQTLYFGLALLNDVFGTNASQPKHSPLIRRVKDNLFSLTFPSALFVTTMFWTLYFINKELIMPDYLMNVMPLWVNHVMHTTIAVFILIEVFSSNINYPSRKIGLSICVPFVFSYCFLLTVAFLKAGTMIYPVLDQVSSSTSFTILLSMTIYGLSMYFVCEKLHSLISPKLKTESGKRKKRAD